MKAEKRLPGRPKKGEGTKEFWRFVRDGMAMSAYDEARESAQKHGVAITHPWTTSETEMREFRTTKCRTALSPIKFSGSRPLQIGKHLRSSRGSPWNRTSLFPSSEIDTDSAGRAGRIESDMWDGAQRQPPRGTSPEEADRCGEKLAVADSMMVGDGLRRAQLLSRPPTER